MVLAGIVIVLVILVLELAIILLIKLFECECLACEPIDRTRDEFLLNVLAQLVIKLQALLDVGSGVIVVVARGLGRREEVEEGVSRDRLLDDARLLGGCVPLAAAHIQIPLPAGQRVNLLLLRCFFCSIRTVRSLPGFQSILSPSAWS